VILSKVVEKALSRPGGLLRAFSTTLLLEVDVRNTDRIYSGETLIVPEHNSSIVKRNLVAIVISIWWQSRAGRTGWKANVDALELI